MGFLPALRLHLPARLCSLLTPLRTTFHLPLPFGRDTLVEVVMMGMFHPWVALLSCRDVESARTWMLWPPY